MRIDTIYSLSNGCIMCFENLEKRFDLDETYFLMLELFMDCDSDLLEAECFPITLCLSEQCQDYQTRKIVLELKCLVRGTKFKISSNPGQTCFDGGFF